MSASGFAGSASRNRSGATPPASGVTSSFLSDAARGSHDDGCPTDMSYRPAVMTMFHVRIWLALTIATLLAACVAAPIGPAPSSAAPIAPGTDSSSTNPASVAPSQAGPSAEPSVDLSGLDEATATAVRIRQSYG